MFAIIETGGKQYRVQRGDVIDVELCPVEGKKIKKVTFERVLMVAGEGGAKVGTPTLAGARVNAIAVGEAKGPKLIVFKKKKRKGYRRLNGHRQHLLRVRIQDIEL